MNKSLKRLKTEQWHRIVKRDENRCAVCGIEGSGIGHEYLYVRRMDDRFKSRTGSEPDDIMNALCFNCSEQFHRTGVLGDRMDIIGLRKGE